MDLETAHRTSSSESTGSRSRWSGKAGPGVGALLFFFAIAVLIQNVVLRRQNQQLKISESTMVSKEAFYATVAPPIDEGRRIQPISGAGADGKFRRVALSTSDGKGTVIFAFSAGCEYCVKNQVQWAALSEKAKRAGWRTIWLSRDTSERTLPYCYAHHIPTAEVISDPTQRTYIQLGLAAVPNTVLINSSGVVQRVWRGRFDSISLGESQHYLSAGGNDSTGGQ